MWRNHTHQEEKMDSGVPKYTCIIGYSSTVPLLRCAYSRTTLYRENKLEIDETSFEAAQSYKYLGSIVNRNNATEEEIKERLIAGNRAFYANQKMFQNNYQRNLN
jgi:hypothetical protein